MRENQTLTSKVLGVVEPIYPLTMVWKPKEDITLHELALCLPYLLNHYGNVYRSDLGDRPGYHLRHFEIIDPNKALI